MSENSGQSAIKSRLLEFIAEKKLSTRRFEIECGLSNASVQNIRRNLGVDKLLKIAGRFPELNFDWLILGRGEMLRQENTSVQYGDTINDNHGNINTRATVVQHPQNASSGQLEDLQQRVEELKLDKQELIEINRSLRDLLNSK